MSTVDWAVLAAVLISMSLYGIWRGRGSTNVQGFLLANRSMKWYTVALSIMATQASAITFTSTPGQGFVDGMRFVQFYFGLPLAMVILSITVVPIYHKLGVYTAYEYIEQRFDAKTRVLTTMLFLLSRGLAAGMTIYAPSLVLSVMLNMDIRITSLIIGGTVILYTTIGGVKAVNYTDVFQFAVILGGMGAAFFVLLNTLPPEVSFADAVAIAGAGGKMNTIDWSLDFKNRYNVWSGLIGGMFVALAYFGTDQSQVQRYLTGQSVTQSRIGLLFNGLAKIPMQYGILLLGVMVFVFFQFVEPPIFFNPVELRAVESSAQNEEMGRLQKKHSVVHNEKQKAVFDLIAARRTSDDAGLAHARKEFLRQQNSMSEVRREAVSLIRKENPAADTNEINYIFLSFVRSYLPVGLIGVLFACIFAASMSSSSGELSALATTTIVDVYKRFIVPSGTEKHYLFVSRISMALWGIYAIAFSHVASQLGSLVEAVNILGSLFYGTMLGIFLLGFYAKRVRGTAVFIGAAAGECVVFCCFWFTSIAWLWYNVIGCGVVVCVAIAAEGLELLKERQLGKK